MKIVTKILNVLVVVFVCIGIYATYGYFYKYAPLKMDYERVQNQNKELSYQQDVNNRTIIQLQTDKHLKDIEIKDRENTINSLRDDLYKLEQTHEEEIKKLENLTLEEAVQFILDYYEVSDDNAEIIMYEDSLVVSFKPLLIHEWTYTLEKLKSRNMEVSVLKNQVLQYDSLIYDYKSKIQLMEKQDSLQNVNYKLEKDKSSGLQKIIENRNQKIKSLKIQRNALGIITGVVIVLAIL